MTPTLYGHSAYLVLEDGYGREIRMGLPINMDESDGGFSGRVVLDMAPISQAIGDAYDRDFERKDFKGAAPQARLRISGPNTEPAKPVGKQVSTISNTVVEVVVGDQVVARLLTTGARYQVSGDDTLGRISIDMRASDVEVNSHG